ncbi:hypothetical protein AGDE_14868 [Angomonas deanei]|uniref:DUF7883 domain-containing protein n=1 Tax=Angomonas deanei TaxID=59799 RepID=A0A7G2CJA6_9TRYP|nr:hypothetical protein AGDE_14868 [Angomonas deanei]CAD2218342.1 hypothetical protein, conserved [Angomonas deanei]|eukprot:EPY20082.1 hypothetical protein AGDE_14868 [Angomonas deanei]
MRSIRIPIVRRELSLFVRRCSYASHCSSDVSSVVRSVLQKNGPLPVAMFTKYLSESTLEQISEKYNGGVGELLQQDTSTIIVPFAGGVKVAIGRAFLKNVDPAEEVLVSHIVGLFAVHRHFPRRSFLPSSSPSISQLLLALQKGATVNLSSVSADALYAVLVRNKKLFSVDRNRLVRVQLVPRPRLFSRESLLSTIPTTFHASVEDVMSKLSGNREETLSTFALNTILESANQLNDFTVDVRTFENSEKQCTSAFVRLVPGSAHAASADLKRMMDGEIKYNTTSRLQTVHSIIEEVEAFLSKDPTNRLFFSIERPIASVLSILSPNLVDTMKRTLATQNEGSLILYFDRARHYFKVNLTDMTVCPWCVCLDASKPSSLTVETSPLPLTLLRLSMELEHGPRSLHKVLDALSFDGRSQIGTVYSSKVCSSREQEVTALKLFLESHSLYFFVKEDEVYTPRSFKLYGKGNQRALAKDAGGGRVSDAQLIFDALPHTQAVVFPFSFLPLNYPYRTTDARAFKEVKREMLLRENRLFQVVEGFGTPKMALRRVDAPPVPSEVLWPSVVTMDVVLRAMALLCVHGQTEEAILQCFTPDMKTVVKRFGSLGEIAEQLPMWFHVKRNRFDSSAIITYIGSNSSAGEADAKPLTLVTNGDWRSDPKQTR